MAGKLTIKQAAALITGVTATVDGMSDAEKAAGKGLSKGSVLKTVAGTAAFAGVDTEGMESVISFDTGISKKQTDTDVTVLGKGKYAMPTDMVDSLDAESFDKLNSQNNITVRLAAINLAANNLMTQDDGIVDLFTVAEIGADETGKRIVASNPLITINSKNINGIAAGGNKIPLISNLDNRDVFAAGRLPLHPILRSSGDYPTADYLQQLVTSSTTVGNETVTTSPILVGKQVDLRVLCGNSSYLNEFGASINPNITMSEEGHLKKTYIKLKDAANVVNLLGFVVKGENGTRFNTTNAGNGKDITLNYKGNISIATSNIVSNKQLAYSSSAGTLVDELTEAGLVINIEFTVNANANTDTMGLSTTATGIVIKSVYKDNVQLLPTNATYIALVDLFKTATVDSLDFDIFQSNTNNTDNGIIIDIEENSYEIPAVIKPPVTFRKSVLGNVPAEQLAGYLSAANITSSSMMATELIVMIEECIANNHGKTDANGFITGVKLDGVGSNYIKAMIVKDSIKATDRITMKSTEVKNDISKTIFDRITAVATRVYTQSGFDKAVAALATGEKVTLQLVGDRETMYYVSNAIAISPNDPLSFDVKASISTKIQNKVYATFKMNEVYEFSPFILVKAPVFIYRGIELAGNSGNQDTCKYVPRRNAIINVPLIMEFDVTDISKAFVRI